MKKLFVLFLLLVISTTSIAAKDIKGKVSNGTIMLQNVFIYIKSTPYMDVLTNENGEFVINLKEVKYTDEDKIIFSHIGYETKEYQIKELRGGICNEITLVRSSIKIDDVIIIGGKLSRREKKNRKISIIKQFKEQAEKDFIFENRTYKVVSNVEITRDAKKVFYNRLIGRYKELIGVLPNNKDSISLTYSDIENYMDNDIELGIEKMSDRFIDNNVVSKKRKENQRMLDSTFYKTLLNDNAILKEVLTVHKSFWYFNRDARQHIMELDDNPNKWEIIEGSKQTILRYKSRYGLLGIVKQLAVIDFVVDPYSYSLERVFNTTHVELNIPFGYKLPPDALMLLNVINANSDEMTKYRARHLHADITFNAIYKKIDATKYADEINCDLNISLIDTKKRNIKGKAKVHVKVLSVEDN